MTTKMLAASAAALLFGAVFGVDYPVITVETDGGTLAAPLLLDEMNVTRITAEEAVPETVTFATIGMPTAGTFRKRGSGFVMGSTQFTNFTGTILVEEGVLCLDRPGQTGPADKNHTAGSLVVSNGATLAIVPKSSPRTCENYGMQVWAKVTAEGYGFNGMGALYNGSTDVNVRETFKGGIALTGDLLIGGPGYGQLGDIAGHNYELNGHSLIVQGNGILVNGAKFEAGHLVITNNSLIQFQSGLTFYGGAENTFKVRRGGGFNSYNVNGISSGWTLDLDDGAKIQMGGIENDNWARKDKNNWGGPIITRGEALINGSAGGYQGANLVGPVSGEGGFKVSRGWLNLYSDNTFTGPLWASDTTKSYVCGIGLHSLHAWPENNTHKLALTNACLWINGDTETILPELDLKSDAGYVSNMVVFGKSSAIASALRKSGAEPVTIETPITVTGRTELAAGTLRIKSPVAYSDAPGLWESRFQHHSSWGTADLNAYYRDGTIAPTNRVTSYPLLAEVLNGSVYTTPAGKNLWGTNDFARYEGYIWNRATTNALYGFALAFCCKGKLYIDDALVFEGQGNWYYLRTNTVDLAPGPHKFDLRLYTTTYTSSGARSSKVGGDYRFYGETAGQTEVDWSQAGKGFVWKLGAATPKCQDYEVPANTGMGGGDGWVFTRDTSVTYRNSAFFSNLVCRTGTTLDLCDSPAPLLVPRLEGFTTVANGSVTVGERWTVSAADVNAGAKLTVGGTMTFADGAVFDLDDSDAVVKEKRGVQLTILEADEIVGMPELSSAHGGACGHLEKSQDGRSLMLFVPRKGTLLIFR